MKSEAERSVVRWPGGVTTTDVLAVEEPMEIRLGTVPLAVLMRTPGLEPELVVGFALTEGIVFGPEEVDRVEDLGDGDRYLLIPAEGVTIDPEQFRRNSYTTSSCGVCGKASIDAVRITARVLPAGPSITPKFGRPIAGQTARGTNRVRRHRRVAWSRDLQPEW